MSEHGDFLALQEVVVSPEHRRIGAYDVMWFESLASPNRVWVIFHGGEPVAVAPRLSEARQWIADQAAGGRSR